MVSWTGTLVSLFNLFLKSKMHKTYLCHGTYNCWKGKDIWNYNNIAHLLEWASSPCLWLLCCKHWDSFPLILLPDRQQWIWASSTLYAMGLVTDLRLHTRYITLSFMQTVHLQGEPISFNLQFCKPLLHNFILHIRG